MKRTGKLLLRTIGVLFILVNVIVIFHAYKFTHFYNRNEMQVKQEKDKTGWDKTKEILFGANFTKQQNIAPDTIIQTIYLVTPGNLKLQAWYLSAASAKGTVALFHGHGGKKSSMLPEAAIFRRLGYNTLLLDFRAHGNSEGNTTTIGFKEAEDVKLVYDYLKQKGEKNIILYGISMGAATIIKSVDEYHLEPAKIILEMPFGSLSQAVKGRVKMMKLPPEPLSTLLTFWGGTMQGFWAFSFNPSGYAKSIRCPVLLQWGKNDPRVTRQETDDIYNNISAPKKFVVYENSGHESLYKKESAKWTGEVTAFLQ